MKMQTMILLGASLSLGACGTMPGDRAASGAGIGAGTGAVLGAITGGSIAGAALLGAAAGGLTGALTSPSQVNLGEPAWKQHAAAQAPSGAGYAANTTVRDIQAELSKAGLYNGPLDGIPGPRTQAAIRSYEQRYGLLVDGQASPALLAHMRQNLSG